MPSEQPQEASEGDEPHPCCLTDLKAFKTHPLPHTLDSLWVSDLHPRTTKPLAIVNLPTGWLCFSL